MKRKLFTFLFALCLILPTMSFFSACKPEDEPPTKTLNSISVESNLIENNQIVVAYQPSFVDYFNINDFYVWAHYSDDSTEKLTTDVTMTLEGQFSATEDGQLAFKYKDETVYVSVDVEPKDITDEDVILTGIIDSYTLTDSYESILPEVTISWGNLTLQKNVDYDVFYGENNYLHIGEDEGEVTISGTGNYTGTINKTFDINPMQSIDNLTFENQTVTYNGNTHYIAIPYEDYSDNPSINFVTYSYSSDNGQTWINDSDIPADAGTYKFKAKFEMNPGYSQIEDKIITVVVNPRSIQDVYSDSRSAIYTGEVIPVTTEIANLKMDESFSSLNLVFGTDYVVDTTYNVDGFVNGYKNNTNAGTAQVRIKGVGNFSEERTISYTIEPKQIKSQDLIIEGVAQSYVFTGKDIEPSVTSVQDGNTVLVEEIDYDISYYNNKYASAQSIVVIKFKGNYKGTEHKYFTITPYQLDISGLEFSADTEDNALIYNFSNRNVEYTGESLNAWLTSLTQSDIINGTEYADLIFSPINLDGVLTIKYVYNEIYEGWGSEEAPINVGNHTVRARFTCVDGVFNETEKTKFLNSIKVMKDGVEVDNKYVEQAFRINQLHISNQNATLEYVDDYGVDIPHFTYGTMIGSETTGVIEPAVRLMVNIEGQPRDFTYICTDYDNDVELGYIYERTNYSNRIYASRDESYKVRVNVSNSSENLVLDEAINLEYYVDSCIITLDNLNDYFKTPTVLMMKGCFDVEGYFTNKEELIVSEAETASNFLQYDDTRYKFSIKTIGRDITGKEVAYLTLLSDDAYYGTYEFEEDLPFNITYIDPVTAGIYTEIKINKTENNYEEADNVTGSFFTKYLLTDGNPIKNNNRIPSGAYIYLKRAQNVVVDGRKNTLGDYSVTETFSAIQVDAPENADYRVFRMENSDAEYNALMRFYTSYNPAHIGSNYEIIEIKANDYNDKIIDFDVLMLDADTETPDDKESVRGYEEDIIDKNHYVLTIPRFKVIPNKLYLTLTIATDVTELGYYYDYTITNSSTYNAVSLEADIYEYTIEVDYAFVNKFFIYINDELTLTISIVEEYYIENIYIITRDHFVAYWTEESFCRYQARIARPTNFYSDCEYEAIITGYANQQYEKVQTMHVDLIGATYDDYVLLNSEGNPITTFTQTGVYTIKLLKYDNEESKNIIDTIEYNIYIRQY